MNDFLQSLRGGQKDKRSPKTRRSFDNNSHYNTPSHYHSQGPYPNTRSGNLKRGTRQAPNPMLPPDEPTPYIDTDAAESIKALAEAMMKHQEILAETAERRIVAEERKANALEDIAEALRFIIASSVDNEGEDYTDETCFPGIDADQEFSRQDKPMAAERLEAKPEPVVPPVAAAVVSEEERLVPRRQPGRPRIVRTPIPEPVEPPQEVVKVLKRTRAQKIEAESGNEKAVNVARRVIRKAPPAKAAKTEGLLSRDEVMETINTMRAQGATFEEVAQHFVSIGQPTFSGRGEWHAQTVHRLCNRRK